MHLKTTNLLNGFHLKWIAMIAMTLDHLAWALLDSDSYLAESLHFVGRLVMPLMAYFLVIGFYHSQNRPAYAKRLLGFAILSQIPFVVFRVGIDAIINNAWVLGDFLYGNVLFTLWLSLLALMVRHTLAVWWQCCALLVIGLLAQHADYGVGLVALVLFFDYAYHRLQLKVMLATYVVILPIIYVLIYGINKTVGLGFMHYGMVLTAILIYFYNGKKGSNFGGRYVFYSFYPIHLLAIAILAYWIG